MSMIDFIMSLIQWEKRENKVWIWEMVKNAEGIGLGYLNATYRWELSDAKTS